MFQAELTYVVQNLGAKYRSGSYGSKSSNMRRVASFGACGCRSPLGYRGPSKGCAVVPAPSLALDPGADLAQGLREVAETMVAPSRRLDLLGDVGRKLHPDAARQGGLPVWVTRCLAAFVLRQEINSFQTSGRSPFAGRAKASWTGGCAARQAKLASFFRRED